MKKFCDESYNANFNLDGSFDTAEHIKFTYEQYNNKRADLWESFFNCMFPHQVNSEHLKCKTNTIFQSLHYTIHNVCRRTPFHVSISQVIHDISRSNIIIKENECWGWASAMMKLEVTWV